MCQKTFTVLPSGRYAPECTVRTVGKRRGFVALIGPALGAVSSVQRKLVKVAHPSTLRRWVGRLLQSAWLRSSGTLPDCSASTRNACSAWAYASSLKREGRQSANPVALAGRITTAAPIQPIGAVSNRLEAYQALKVFSGPSALKPCRPPVPSQFRHLASRSSAPTG